MADFSKKEVLLKVEHLCQYFKMGGSQLKAVDDVNFEIHKGEVFGLVGESGCGKTTTGRSIIKLYNITSGSIYFKGRRICAGTLSYKQTIKNAKKDLADGKISKEEANRIILEQRQLIKAARYDHRNCDRDYAREKIAEYEQEYKTKLESSPTQDQSAKIEATYKDEVRIVNHEKFITQIQMIFQDPIASLDPRMTVREIISEGLIIKGIRDKKFIDSEVKKMLELVGLVGEHADRYPHEFSGGQRQRIGVARSIIMKPELIIADEPISALDVSIQAQVINLLNDLRNQLGLTIMFIAHDLSVVKYFSDRIGVMYYGKMVELASSDELFAHPLHPYTRSLLSAIPLPDPVYEKKRKRITYVPLRDHDYSTENPIMQEVLPGHFVLCNSAEKEKYINEIGVK